MTRRALPFTTLVAAVLLLAGCGGNGDSAGSDELCDRYDEIVATAEDFGELDAAETSADELRARATDFRDRLDELQAVAQRERDRHRVVEPGGRASTLPATPRPRPATRRRKGWRRPEKSLKEVNEKWDGSRPWSPTNAASAATAMTRVRDP